MNNNELGRVHGFMLRHRIAATKSHRRTAHPDERDVAALLRDADPLERKLLAEILEGQGLVLKEFHAMDVPGIPDGASVFILARPQDSLPRFWGMDQLVARMLIRGIESAQEAKVWFVQLWFIHLDLLYSRRNRGPDNLQAYLETAFHRDVFYDAVRDYRNDVVLKMDETTLANAATHKMLRRPKEGTVAELCNAFLELMVEASLLERVSEDTYRQTLLSAYEMKVNYDRQLAYLLPISDVMSATQHIVIEVPETQTKGD